MKTSASSEQTIAPKSGADFTRLVREVQRCACCAGMTLSHVLGHANGRLDARVIFVAEAVGRRGGAITGVPLSRDESGRRFAAFLDVAGVCRDEVFITNAVLCNPVDGRGRNRPPTVAETARCRPFLQRTFEIVRAPVVVTLGRVALESLRAIAPHDATVATHVATPVEWRGRVLVPMYHPSRQSTLHRAHDAQERDWRRLGELIRGGETRGL